MAVHIRSLAGMHGVSRGRSAAHLRCLDRSAILRGSRPSGRRNDDDEAVMPGRTLALAAATALVAVAFGAGHAQPARPRSVVIVTLDTTRADYLAAYGSTRTSTPALDRLAREGVVFEEATTV